MSPMNKVGCGVYCTNCCSFCVFLQAERAIDEKLLNPESVVLLKTAVTRQNFQDLISSARSSETSGNVVVTLVKTPVHG